MSELPTRQDIREWEYWLEKLEANDPGLVISPEGWRDAVRKLLNYVYEMEGDPFKNAILEMRPPVGGRAA